MTIRQATGRFARVLIALVVLVGTLAVAAPQADAAAGPCTVSGNRGSATWGCGKALWDRTDKSSVTVTIEDTKTDGACIEVQAKTRSHGWISTGILECNEVATIRSFSLSETVIGVRIRNRGSGRWTAID